MAAFTTHHEPRRFLRAPHRTPGGLCGHHSAGHGGDWARGNRLMCDLLHRGITSSRPHEVDRLEQEGWTLADELGDRAIFSRLDVTSDRDWARRWPPPRTPSARSPCC